MKNLHQRMDKTASQHQMPVTLNLNWLNPPIKRHSQNSSVCCIQTHLPCKNTQRLKTKGWRKIYQANGEHFKKNKRQELQFSSLIKATKTKRDKEGHYIMVKGSMQQEELTILNIYALNTVKPRYIKQVLNDLLKET